MSREDLAGEIDLILDGGRCPMGLESTVVACLEGPPRLLRPGGISRAEIEAGLGFHAWPTPSASGGVRSPGMLASHYAPRAKLRLEATQIETTRRDSISAGVFSRTNVRDLSPTRDLAEAAANLFTYLRELDALDVPRIAVAPIPDEGLGEAINDRLARAAAPRTMEPS